MIPIPLALFLTGVLLQEDAAPRPHGLVRHEPTAFSGYTLIAPLASATTALIDMQGRVVQRWPGTHGPSAAYLLEDGTLLRCVRIEDNPTFEGGGICGRIELVRWDGTLAWEYELANEDQTQHHDVEALPNGNVLLITWEYRFREDVLAAGRAADQVPDKGFWPDAVLELRPLPPKGADVVWEWHVWDHLIQDHDPEADNHGSVADHPGRVDLNADHRAERARTEEERRRAEEVERQMAALGYTGGGDEDDDADTPAPPGDAGASRGHGSDWLHTNSIDYWPSQDLVLLSTPHLSELWILDHSTTTEEAADDRGGRFGRGGEILWRWGNPRHHGAGDEADQRLFYQHDAQWIPEGLPGAGHLLVFNNGRERPGGEHSSVDELVLPFDPEHGFAHQPGRPFGPERPVWSYSDPEHFFAPFISGCQRLPNGDTLICEGPKGRVFEVTPDGAIVWEYWNTLGGDLPPRGAGGIDPQALFRATRVAPDHPALRGRTLVPLEDGSPTDAPR